MFKTQKYREKTLNFLQIFIFFSTYFNFNHAGFVDIQTSLGQIRGIDIKSSHNAPGIGFLGVPYAKPPVGERRFKVSLEL